MSSERRVNYCERESKVRKIKEIKFRGIGRVKFNGEKVRAWGPMFSSGLRKSRGDGGVCVRVKAPLIRVRR